MKVQKHSTLSVTAAMVWNACVTQNNALYDVDLEKWRHAMNMSWTPVPPVRGTIRGPRRRVLLAVQVLHIQQQCVKRFPFNLASLHFLTEGKGDNVAAFIEFNLQ